MEYVLSWPNGFPIDAAVCGYCRAPITRGARQHACNGPETPNPQPVDDRAAARQAEALAAAVDARLSREIRVGDRVRMSAKGIAVFPRTLRTGVVVHIPHSRIDLIDVRRDGQKGKQPWRSHRSFWELDQ